MHLGNVYGELLVSAKWAEPRLSDSFCYSKHISIFPVNLKASISKWLLKSLNLRVVSQCLLKTGTCLI